MSNIPASDSPSRTVLGPSLVYGFGSAIAVWVAWFATHVPWVTLEEPVRVGIVLGLWVVVAFCGGRAVGGRIGAQVGALSGLVAAIVGLLLLGAKINPPPGSTAATPAYLIVPGFLGLGVVLGLIAGVVGGLSKGSPSPQRPWLQQFAAVTVLAAAPLLFIGGLVTTTNQGMAVPDWPQTNGMNMFLYPLGNANVGTFLEHSHRLFGTLVGLTALVLLIWTLRAEPRKWVRGVAIGVFTAIVIQGILGGGRVIGNSVAAAIVHGVFAQLIFAGLCALAVMIRTTPQRLALAQPFPKARRIKASLTGAMHATVLQVIFGAVYRHLRGSSGANHALFSHVGFSFIVLVAALFGGLLATGIPAGAAGPERSLRRLGQFLVAAVLIQFTLGWTTLFLGGGDRVPDMVSQAILRTAHQANGALMLGLATAAAVLAKMIYRATSQQEPRP